MRYWDAFRLEGWLFVRCSECGSLVADVDRATHDAWHENMTGFGFRAGGQTTYRTKTGKVLTDADIEALADEAEKGYDVSQIKPRTLMQLHEEGEL